MIHCKRCQETFTKNSSLVNHLKKKKECPGTFDRAIQLEELSELRLTLCEHCGKTFSARQKLEQHLLHRVCQRDTPAASSSQITERDQEIRTLRTEMASIRKKINELTHTPHVSSTVTNSHNTTNSHNNITQNIQLNFFGEEDLRHITEDREQFCELMEKRILSEDIIGEFCKHLSLIFFDPEHKENQTITGAENGNITMFKKLRKRGSYQTVPEKDAIPEIATHTATHYRDYFAEHCPNDKVSRDSVVNWVEQIGDFVNHPFTIRLFQRGTKRFITDWIDVDEHNLTPEQKRERDEQKQEFYKSIALSIREALEKKFQCDVEVS